MLLVACEKETSTSGSSKKDVPVIESFLLAGSDTIKVKVSTLLPYTNDTTDTVEPLAGLNIMVNDYLLQEVDPGTYIYVMKDNTIAESDSFSLSFDFNSKTISATTAIPTKPSGMSISDDTIKIKKQTASTKPEDFSSSSSTTLEITWDNTAKEYHYLTIDWIDTTEVFTNTMMDTTDISTQEVGSANQDDVYNINQMNLRLYGKYRVILHKINKEYYDLMETTNKNSNSMTNPPSNVANGWGVFTALSTDTLYFWVIKK